MQSHHVRTPRGHRMQPHGAYHSKTPVWRRMNTAQLGVGEGDRRSKNCDPECTQFNCGICGCDLIAVSWHAPQQRCTRDNGPYQMQ